jgi:hypothetical protein
MSDNKEIREVVQREKRSEKIGKYKPLPRNKRTETAIAQLFENGTERELTRFLRENGVPDDSPRFAEIVKLFHEHAGKRS